MTSGKWQMNPLTSTPAVNRRGRLFDWITRLDPGASSAEDIEQIFKSLTSEDARRRARTISTRANHRRRTLPVQVRMLADARQWSADRRRHMSAVVFARLANINHLQITLRL